jgi:phosphatidylglycerophosphate synthase
LALLSPTILARRAGPWLPTVTARLTMRSVQYDGIVSRQLNRRLSRPLAGLLANTSLAPGLVATLVLGVALATGAMVAAGWSIAGGIAIQATAILAGLGADLARVRGATSRFGDVIDGIAGRYAEAAILAGMTIYAVRFETLPQPEVMGLLALGGALTLSYSDARIEASLGRRVVGHPADLVFGLASPDVRLLIAAVGTVAGQCYWTLAVLTAITGLTIAWRLFYLRRIAGAID